MKILLISTTNTTTPPKAYGGIERVVYDLACVLASRGHSITLAAAEGSIPPQGADLISVEPQRGTAGEHAALKKYEGLLDSVDVVCDHSHLKLAAASLHTRAAYVPVCHGTDLPSMPPGTIVTCVSKAHADLIHSKYDVPTRCIYNGICLEDYPPNLDNSQRLERCLFMGRFTPEKGILDALQASKAAGVGLDVVEGRLAEPARLRLLRGLAGAGLPVDRLARRFYHGEFPLQYVLRSARALGGAGYFWNINHEKKVELLRRSKALLAPTTWVEPFGLNAVEAMACGTPVVAYRKGGLQETVADGKTGFLLEPGDVSGMTSAIGRLGGIEPRDCRERVEKNFSRERMADEYLAVFASPLR